MKTIAVTVVLVILGSFFYFPLNVTTAKNLSLFESDVQISSMPVKLGEKVINYSDLILTSQSSSNTPGFIRTLGSSQGGEYGTSIILDSDDDMIVAGAYGGPNSIGTNDIDIFVARVGLDKRVKWGAVFGGTEYEKSVKIIKASDGNYILLGNTRSFGKGLTDILVMKISSSGYIMWAKAFGTNSDDTASSIAETSDGGFVIAGTYGEGSAKLFLVIKLTSNGSLSWAKTYKNSNINISHSIKQTSDGGYIVLGKQYSTTLDEGTLLIKINSSGTLTWAKVYFQGNKLIGKSLDITSDGGFIIAGESRSTVNDSMSSLLFKVKSDGSLLWAEKLLSSYGNGINSISKNVDGSFITAGYTDVNNGDCLVIKFSSNGIIEWSKRIGGRVFDSAYDVKRTDSGEFVMVGETNSFGFDITDILLARFMYDGIIYHNIGGGSIVFPEPYFSNYSASLSRLSVSVSDVTPNTETKSLSITVTTPELKKNFTNLAIAPALVNIFFYDNVNTSPYKTRYILFNHSFDSDMPQNPTREGYTFTGWNTKSDGSGASFTDSTVVISEDLKVYAQWKMNTYTITASASSGGSITPSGSVVVNHGDSKTFTIQPNLGFKIKEVKVDGSSVGAVSTYTFTNITGNHTIEAVFEAIAFTITASSGTGGSITPSGSVVVNHGDSKTFTIQPNLGFKIKEVKVDGSSVGAVSTYTFTNITGNHTIEAVFEKVEDKIVMILQIGNARFTVNGVAKTLDSPPIIKNSRTLLPIRAVVESLGGTIDWNGTERKVTISFKGKNIELWIGKAIAMVDGVSTQIDPDNKNVVPEIINSRTMLPLRFVAESLGCVVQWDGTTKTITITYPKP
ncbi:stalk domain-containing protein [Caldisericum exile]|nr:stalk domain-containing protein [Caldisericum exile]